jgi:vitamin B12/bleomycin/antimicrobial peptide transport system ATP-binding/permease protein
MTALNFEDRENIKGARRATSALEQADRGANPLKRRLLLRRFWKGATGFWLKGGGRLSWVLPAAIFSMVLLGLATSYGINIWNRAMFDALERRDAGTVVFCSIVYFPLLAASVCLVLAQVYARMTMQRR